MTHIDTGKKDKDSLLYRRAKDIQLLVFDFDGVFTDNRVMVMQNGSEGVLCCRGDGFGISAVKALGIKVMVISTETNPVVDARCKKLGLSSIQACNNKAQVLKREAEKLSIPLEKVAYMGNDINDLECLNIVGLPACVLDSYPDVLKVAKYISKTKGGYGAVREFCDYLATVKTGKFD